MTCTTMTVFACLAAASRKERNSLLHTQSKYSRRNHEIYAPIRSFLNRLTRFLGFSSSASPACSGGA